jgi:transposase
VAPAKVATLTWIFKEAGRWQRHDGSDQDFQEGAIRLVNETGSRSRRSPGKWINAAPLANWVNADRRHRPGNGVLSEDERAELARLRRENAELLMEAGELGDAVLGLQVAPPATPVPATTTPDTETRPTRDVTNLNDLRSTRRRPVVTGVINEYHHVA